MLQTPRSNSNCVHAPSPFAKLLERQTTAMRTTLARLSRRTFERGLLFSFGTSNFVEVRHEAMSAQKGRRSDDRSRTVASRIAVVLKESQECFFCCREECAQLVVGVSYTFSLHPSIALLNDISMQQNVERFPNFTVAPVQAVAQNPEKAIG